MASRGLAELTADLYKLLEPLDSGERTRLISATLTLLGDSHETFPTVNSSPTATIQQHVSATVAPENAREYFDLKDPQGKSEELAVAARYREEKKGESTHEKEQLKEVFKDARKNFDSANFSRDMGNARLRGFFNNGSGNVLSAYGIKYADALPDRESAKSLPSPKKRKNPATKAKKAKAETK